MLTGIALQLARGMRSKRVLPIFNCSNLEIALSALSVAEDQKLGIILSVDMANTKVKKSWHFLELLAYYAKQSKVPVSVLLQGVNPQECDYYQSYLEKGMSVLVQDNEFENFSVDRVLFVSREEKKSDLVEQCVALYQHQDGYFSQEKMAQIKKDHYTYNIPYILDMKGIKVVDHKKLLKVGVLAFYLRDELDMAYTAGLRSAVRDKLRSDPHFFKERSIFAVEKTVQSYLTSFQYK